MRRDLLIVRDGDARLRPGAARRAQRRRRRTAVVAVVAAAVSVVGGIRLADDVQRAAAVVAADQPMVASDKTVLTDLWRDYRQTHLEPGTGRTLVLQDGAVTTSQGQGDTMLRAVWMDDQETFAQSWQWTKDNLQRDDALLASRFGERPDGSYGIQAELGGEDPVSGADVDVAFALLMAYSRWQEDDHLYDALPLIEAVWERSVVRVDGGPVLVASDSERDDAGQVLVTPASFAPYAFRVFARVDPQHDWPALVDNSYALLAQLADEPLDADRTAGLPPDRVSLDRRTGEFSAVGGDVTTQSGRDALRLSWRLALDHAWYGDERALRLLEGQSVLADSWTDQGRLVAAYDRDGTPAVDRESPAVYGGAMGYFDTVRPDLADEVYADELLPLYDADSGDMAEQLSNDDANWVWFGMALHLDELPNLNVTEE
ncbi:glycosyl hydrolase family 8 [Geodermatophilus obscurus]|uniref:Glycoside hydrolase family 8 n=1 Tax=Geodermatophilus obscurus (strain ATCC 25078 / DSM 43160 / JCM 3152 / CCUG 61914 / KCC A-0152 / KCTC 9177 / NBRC 13315 / NRRL B-3577 / G-20) TaxID=526225 RepID=D2S408_GEOOG|nr:glycosyl hydrolase family 8 [Geodermatophilus obscurus]ADB73036.1 glycoside hydrolase family 8 [Geodermatophilus obscurus DSM 43160]